MDAYICYLPSSKYSNIDQWLAQLYTRKNFQRTIFIADQPKLHVPFLLAFMETQSFISFVDSKIASRFNQDNHFFDRRDLTYQAYPSIDLIDKETRCRFTSPFPSLILMNAPSLRLLDNSISTSKYCYLFENLNGTLLESSSSSSIINISLSVSTRRVIRFKKQQTVAASEHQQHVVLVQNEVVFQQLLKECITKQCRVISSTITGQIYNTMGDGWQELADTLHQLAVAHGAVSKIELDDPRVGDVWLDFFIGYDDAGGAKKFVKQLEALNKLQPLSHIRVIDYTPRPNPQPQPIV
ncbi:unnamed protein product [Rotaria sordida]|uniref:dDENN domain-containing protein n=1 Tax=Rotaria sordida TaxID=392033 RepID=A0A818KYS8_9BILA|nr:unnamed protein product [Rotaria sordida]